MDSYKTFTVYSVTAQEQFQGGLNDDRVEVVVVCYSGHGNGKFLKDSTLWRTAETKLFSSDKDITSYCHKSLLKDKLKTFFKGQETVEVVDSPQWLRSLIDELCKNVKPSTEVNEVVSSMKEDTVTVDVESPQSEMDPSVHVEGMTLNVMWQEGYCGYV